MKQQQAKVYYQVGNNFLRKGNFFAAIRSYKDAIHLDPYYFRAYCNLGVALKNAGLLKEAEDILEKALRLKPHSAVVFNNLGNVYTAMNKFERAKICYRRAIAIYPRYKAAYFNLGQVLYHTGETAKGLESLVTRAKIEEDERRRTN